MASQSDSQAHASTRAILYAFVAFGRMHVYPCLIVLVRRLIADGPLALPTVHVDAWGRNAILELGDPVRGCMTILSALADYLSNLPIRVMVRVGRGARAGRPIGR